MDKMSGATAPLPEPWQEEDFSGCFWLAVQDAKERVQRGEPLPRWLQSTREDGGQ